MDEIKKLQEENEIMKYKIQQMEGALQEYQSVYHNLIEQVKEVCNVIFDHYKANQRDHLTLYSLVYNMPFEIGDLRGGGAEFFYPKIIDSQTAVQEIIDQKKSIARFGDGEFAIICGHVRSQFQRVDEDLGKRLKQVLQSDIDNLMIGIADNYGNLDKYTDFAANGIRLYMQNDIRREHMELLSSDRIYYDAYLSRPYVMYRDHFTDAPKKRFEHLKQIWDGRDVIMVEGAQTRLGVGNDLFDNCKTIRRILAPATDSYDRYDDILQSAIRNGKEGDLFIIATGPSAGVFAYDLTLKGFQAVDVGHVDIEYEWYLNGTGERTAVAHKYTHEVSGKEEAEEIHDPVYESQIVDAFY
ncbi:MAG: DUF1792 domain-containing protein [Eubacterium sp.]|nr:DUF1792 domain-containing protein [Eubacterium sp.]